MKENGGMIISACFFLKSQEERVQKKELRWGHEKVNRGKININKNCPKRNH